MRPRKRKKFIAPIEQFVEARLARHGHDPASNNFRKHTRLMWEAAQNSLLIARKEGHIDKEIAEWLSSTVDELLANRTKTPTEILPLLQAGGISNTAASADAKRTAALYRQAVSAGHIKDKAPIKTLMKEFNCAEQTIHDWIQKAPKGLWKNFRPKDKLAVREKYLRMRLKYDGKLIRTKSQTKKSIYSRG